jgi:hypothetical protein
VLPALIFVVERSDAVGGWVIGGLSRNRDGKAADGWACTTSSSSGATRTLFLILRCTAWRHADVRVRWPDLFDFCARCGGCTFTMPELRASAGEPGEVGPEGSIN